MENSMSRFDEIDFFSDATLLEDPHPYLDYLRAKGPAAVIQPYNVVAVTGYDEGMAVYLDEHFSSINVSFGPIPPMPFTPKGDDITDEIERHRNEIPGGTSLVALDPPAHTRAKYLLRGIITPKRFKENEEFLWRLADQQIDEFIDAGSVELVSQFAQPFTMLAVANLLGVPAEHFDRIRNPVSRKPGQIALGATGMAADPFERIAAYFAEYVDQRRREPRQDVLGQLAAARYPDGSIPSVRDVASVGTILFAAGGDTTTRTIAAALRILAEDTTLQRGIRDERRLIPDFVEEVLRLHGTVKSDFRLAKMPVKVGAVDVRPGMVVMLVVAAMNRDPRRFDRPHELRLDRANLREQIAFGRGIHACAGAPLARAELKVTLERFFDRTSDIRIDQEKHGPPGARRYTYLPSYLLQGVNELYLRFDKA
jgi:cytochrome P450